MIILLAQVQRRLDQAYQDKLDGKITEELWDRKSAGQRLDRSISLVPIERERNNACDSRDVLVQGKSVVPCSKAIAAIKTPVVVTAIPFESAPRKMLAACRYVENPLGSSQFPNARDNYQATNEIYLLIGLRGPQVRISWCGLTRAATGAKTFVSSGRNAAATKERLCSGSGTRKELLTLFLRDRGLPSWSGTRECFSWLCPNGLRDTRASTARSKSFRE